MERKEPRDTDILDPGDGRLVSDKNKKHLALPMPVPMRVLGTPKKALRFRWHASSFRLLWCNYILLPLCFQLKIKKKKSARAWTAIIEK